MSKAQTVIEYIVIILIVVSAMILAIQHLSKLAIEYDVKQEECSK